jgi:DNA-binding XRE family transcriptional regulator
MARKNLFIERVKLFKTQKQIANALGITERQYQRIETGSSDGSIKLWKQLSLTFKKSIDYLLAQSDDGSPPGA